MKKVVLAGFAILGLALAADTTLKSSIRNNRVQWIPTTHCESSVTPRNRNFSCLVRATTAPNPHHVDTPTSDVPLR